MVGVSRIAGDSADEEELFRELFPNLGQREYLLLRARELRIRGPFSRRLIDPSYRYRPA